MNRPSGRGQSVPSPRSPISIRRRWRSRSDATRAWRAASASPTTGLGVFSQSHDIGQLGSQRVGELRCGEVVVALLTDVGVGARAGDWVASAVAVGDAGLQHLGFEPGDSVRDEAPGRPGDQHGKVSGTGSVHRLVVGPSDCVGREVGVAKRHLGRDVSEERHESTVESGGVVYELR